MEKSRIVSPLSTDAMPATSIRAHDEAMIAWLREIIFNGEPAKVRTGHESRFFSQAHERQEGIEGETRQAVPFPVITITNISTSPDPSRWTRSPVRMLGIGPSTVNNTMYLDPETKTEIIHLPFPMPLDFMYQVDIWTKSVQDMNELRTSLLLRWDNPVETFLNVELPGYGDKIVPLMLNRDDDTSELETGEEERLLRHTFTLILKGWIFKYPCVSVLENGKVVLKPQTIKSILKSHVAMIDGDHTDTELVAWYTDPDHYNFDPVTGELLSVTESPEHTPPARELATLSFGL